jgi:DNA helicase MCM8
VNIQLPCIVQTHTAVDASSTVSTAEAFTIKDLHFVATYHRTCGHDQLLHLAHSLCPAILGHQMVKIGLVLSLLTSSSVSTNALAATAARSTAHVLLVGDPGLGKSQLLRAVTAAAPHSVYVNSMSSTSAGLTVSVARDVVTNDMAFEAGALVLADGGVCCLDELDNMANEHKTLLEVMEQQEVCLRC